MLLLQPQILPYSEKPGENGVQPPHLPPTALQEIQVLCPVDYKFTVIHLCEC